MRRILQIGHYCAVGGIGVHMQRLVKLLKDDFSISIIDESKLKDSCKTIYNVRTKNPFKYLGLYFKADIIHIHTLSTVFRLIHAFLGFIMFKRVVVTVHSLTLVKNKRDLFLVKLTLMLATKVIVVNDEIKRTLNISKAIVLPAFLPPDPDNEKDLPEEIKKYLEHNKGKKIIVGNAFRLNIYNGEDLYGTDLLIDVARKIKKNNDGISIIFIITSLDVNKELFFKYKQQIKDEKLEEQIFLYRGIVSFVKLILESDMVVRPTNTDGDALTVREALYFGKPVIASDVVSRPKGTILFKNRDSEDLYRKIISFFSKNNEHHEYQESKKTNKDYKQIYKEIYLE